MQIDKLGSGNTDFWNPADYDDEPRTDGKSDLDLFRESCEAADGARRERKLRPGEAADTAEQ